MKKNLGLKIASLALALIMWLSVVVKEQSSVIVDVPVKFKNMPAGIEAVDDAPTAAVSLRGPERLLRNLASPDVRIYLDMGRAQTGRHSYAIDSDSVYLPALVNLISVSPASVFVTIEETRKKVEIRGKP
ncbi:MAG: hypothetical protein Q8J64_07270 [Thermodesulfovibrionales bacterium]|nr:hypothetical protein [Thermodesulfovibrionales bacterium]